MTGHLVIGWSLDELGQSANPNELSVEPSGSKVKSFEPRGKHETFSEAPASCFRQITHGTHADRFGAPKPEADTCDPTVSICLAEFVALLRFYLVYLLRSWNMMFFLDFEI